MAEITTTSMSSKPFMSIETKGDKKMDKMIKYIGEDFIKNKNQRMERRIASKLKTRMQLAFLGSNVKTEMLGDDFKVSVNNIPQINQVLNDKVVKDVGRYTNELYQDEFSLAKEVK